MPGTSLTLRCGPEGPSHLNPQSLRDSPLLRGATPFFPPASGTAMDTALGGIRIFDTGEGRNVAKKDKFPDFFYDRKPAALRRPSHRGDIPGAERLAGLPDIQLQHVFRQGARADIFPRPAGELGKRSGK